MLGLTYNPYGHQEAARSALARFAQTVFSSPMGLVWSEPAGSATLRPPIYDSEGLGLTLVAILHPPAAGPAPTAAKPQEPTHIFLRRILDAIAASQVEQAEMQRMQAEATVAVVQSAAARARQFLETHKILAGSLATGLDALGVIAGFSALITIGPALATAAGVAGVLMATIPPLIGGAAGFASLGLFAADGWMTFFQVTQDAEGAKWLEDASAYQWIEAVGPLILVPDLLLNLPRAVLSTGRAAGELRRLPAEIGETTGKLNRSRDDLQAFYDTDANRNDPKWVQRLTQIRNKTAALAADLSKAKSKLKSAEHELQLARMRDFPAWGGSAYAAGVYAVDPPALAQNVLSPQPAGNRPTAAQAYIAGLKSPAGASQSALPAASIDPWSFLIPDLPDRCVGAPANLELRVAIARKPQRAQKFADWDNKPAAPLAFQDWDKR